MAQSQTPSVRTASAVQPVLRGSTDGLTTALSPVPRGASIDAELLRVSVDTARKYPRDEADILKRLLATITAFPQFAEKAIYRIEYKDKRARTGKTIVSGMSIRAAETIAGEWGHLWVAAQITGETDDYLDTEAFAFDAQKNNINRLPFRVSKYGKSRDTGQFYLLDDRAQLMALQAGISKCRRNAVLAVLPMHVKAAFERAVREAIGGGDLAKPADVKRVDLCVAAYQEHFGVTSAQLESYVEKPRQLWTGGDLADLRSLYNALEDGEATIAETFAVGASDAITPDGATPVVTVEEGMLGSTVTPTRPVPMGTAPPIVETAVSTSIETLSVVSDAGTRPFAMSEIERLKADLAAAESRVGRAVVPSSPPPAKLFETELEGLLAKLDAASTAAETDQILGQLYVPGGPLQKAPREVKRAVLAKVGAKRDALAKAAATTT